MSKKKILGSSVKTLKGRGKNYETHIVYFDPAYGRVEGSHISKVCPNASAGCMEACLVGSGNGGFRSNVRTARWRKTNWYFTDRRGFLFKLSSEIDSRKRNDPKRGYTPCFRLNGTSDVPWHTAKLEGIPLMDLHSDVQFYDYTPNVHRMKKFLRGELPTNYHLCFSRKENNWDVCKEILAMGGTVAVVFEKTKKEPFPPSYDVFPVIDGDDDDLRFLDPKGVIVGLSYKKLTIPEISTALNKKALEGGFVVRKKEYKKYFASSDMVMGA